MIYQILFSLKNNEKVLINVVCCSRDWRFKSCMMEQCMNNYRNFQNNCVTSINKMLACLQDVKVNI